MIRALILLPLLFFSDCFLAQQTSDRPAWLALESLIKDVALAHGTVAFKAVNLSDGHVAIDYNSQQSMVPASLQKLVTTAAALERHGANFQFKTELLAPRELEEGEANRNIYIRPSGDPTLQSRYYSDGQSSLAQLSTAIKKLEGFKGNLLIEASLINMHATPSGWMWEDMGNYFGATPTALIWRDNLLEVYLNTNQAGTQAMLSDKTKHVEEFDIDIQVTASAENRDNAWFFSAPQTNKIYAKGTIPANKSNFLVKASHPNPMLQFGHELLAASDISNKEVKIEYEHIPRRNLKVIETITSPQLHTIVRLTNQRSINVYAEALAISLDTARFYKSTEGGIAGIKQFLSSNKINTGGLVMRDGSGLSPMNRMTCETMVGLLIHMQQAKTKVEFENSLAVAAESGTLRTSFGELAGKMKAKSGTMTGVRNYAGYLTNTRGEQIAFCVMVNDHDSNRSSTIKNKIEKLLLEISKE